ncbi:MAG TPA: hypothetical protein VLS44_02665, partial [Nitrospira sp.]|nr:hypothetical protein [Nitrospira sp.]
SRRIVEKHARPAARRDQKRRATGATVAHDRISLRALRRSLHPPDTMRTAMYRICLLLAIGLSLGAMTPVLSAATPDREHPGWRSYTNARFGFSVRYPETWKLGKPLPDGIGNAFQPPIDQSLVAFSGHMNLLEGSSQDKRQTLGEFATAHRRIITDLFEKKKVTLTWQKEQDTTLAGFPAKRLAFTYQDEHQTAMLEVHLFSLGRNEGRGVRIKVPVAAQADLLPTITKMLETYQPGRDQNAVSPLAPKPDSPGGAPRS